MTELTNEEVISGNKLIVKDRNLLRLIETFMGYADGNLSEIITWNDLMPAVEKIEREYCKRFEIIIYSSSCYINKFNGNRYEHFISHVGKKIEAVWRCVVSFLTWLNSQPTAQASVATDEK